MTYEVIYKSYLYLYLYPSPLPLGLNESAGKRGLHMMNLNNHHPPLLPYRSLSARTESSPLLPPSASSLRCLVDSNRRAAYNQLDVVGHHLLDPNPVERP